MQYILDIKDTHVFSPLDSWQNSGSVLADPDNKL